jgi:hypothetical protein
LTKFFNGDTEREKEVVNKYMDVTRCNRIATNEQHLVTNVTRFKDSLEAY